MGEILATRSLQPKSKHDYGCGGQAASAHYQLAEKVDSRCAAPKGASDFEGLTVSLKRYPDTKPEFFPQVDYAQGNAGRQQKQPATGVTTTSNALVAPTSCPLRPVGGFHTHLGQTPPSQPAENP